MVVPPAFSGSKNQDGARFLKIFRTLSQVFFLYDAERSQVNIKMLNCAGLDQLSRSTNLPSLLFVLLALIRFGHFSLLAQGLPEPSLTLYGTVTNLAGLANSRLTAGTLTWRFVLSDGSAPVILTTQLANINDQFSFRLTIPCETQIGALTISANTLKFVTPPISYDRSQATLDANPATLAQPDLGTFTLSRSERGRVLRVDLLVSISRPDTDGNGLTDDWEMRHFAALGINPDADPDHDGMSNFQEMKAGTDPNDAQSAFAFIEMRLLLQGGIEVRWSSVQGKVYTIQRSQEISTGFVDVKTGIAATSPINSFDDPEAAGAGVYFYRLRVEE